MSVPVSWNTVGSGLSAHVFGAGTSPSVLLCGDSLSSGEPSTSGQGWDNIWYGIMRSWSPARWRGFSYELQKDASNYNPSPDIFTVTHSTAGNFQKPPSDTWLPDSAAGIMPNSGYSWLGVNGLLQNYYQGSANPAGVSASLAECMMDTLNVRTVFHRHAAGPDAIQVQSQREAQSLSAVVPDLSGTAGLVSYDIASGIQSTADNTKKAIVVVRQRVADGDLSAKYTRLCDVHAYRSGTGLYMDSIAIGSSDSQNWGSAYGVGTGYFTDASLRSYMTFAPGGGIDTVFFMIGQNDLSGFNKATFKANVQAFADRAHAAMVANGIATPRICLIGTYLSQNTGNTLADVLAVNEACYEVAVAGAALGKQWSFISLLAAMNYQRISASYMFAGQDIHPNVTGANYLATLIQSAVTGQLASASAGRANRYSARSWRVIR